MKRLSFLLLLIVFQAWVIQAQDTASLKNPVAYIGRDGNVYVTDGAQTFALTNDAALDKYVQGVRYSLPRWSHDGTKLAFVRNEGMYHALWIAVSGTTPIEFLASTDTWALYAPVVAWSPDDRQIAVFGDDRERSGLYRVPLEDAQPVYVAPVSGGCIGEAGDDDPAKILAEAETGNSPYSEQYGSAWTDGGIFYTPVEACSGVALVTVESVVRLQDNTVFDAIFAPDTARVTAYSFQNDALMLEVITPEGKLDVITLPEDSKPLAWSGDHLIYRRRSDITEVRADLSVQPGKEVFDGMWGFRAENSTLTLWDRAPSGEETQIFQLPGYDFGVVKAAGDNRWLVSVISSNADAVTALNNGAATADVVDMQARPTIFIVENGKIAEAIEGSQPDISSSEFTPGK